MTNIKYADIGKGVKVFKIHYLSHGSEYNVTSIFRVSYFLDLFHEPLDKWNNSKTLEMRKILDILYEVKIWKLAYY